MGTTPEICPCGSGQVSYSCCLGFDPSPTLLLEAQFCERMRQFALRSRGPAWFRQAEESLRLELDDQELFENWYSKLLFYHYDQPSVYEAFLASGPTLSGLEKALLWSLQQIRLSIFLIVDIRRGHSILMEDLLFGGQAWVMESTLAEPDMLKAVLLARLAPVGEEVLLMGMYIRPMAEWKARKIAQELLELSGPGLEPQALCQHELASWLTNRFRQGLLELDECTMPMQVTPEGEPLCQVRDRFSFKPEARASVRQALHAFPELYWESLNSAHWIVGTSELGHVILHNDALVLECKSLGRADRLGESLGRIPHLKKPRRSQQPPPSEESIRREYETWSRQWPDLPLETLDGLTPRGAVANRKGRLKVEAMISDFEAYQASLPPAQSITLKELRRELDLL